MERNPYVWSELFSGNWNLFSEVLKNSKNIFIYDIDGILANSTKTVFKNFSGKTGIYADPLKLFERGYLSVVAETAGLNKEIIEHAEDGWYDSQILLSSHRYLYIKPVVEKTMRYYGKENNFVLTSRNPQIAESTFSWFVRELPEFKKENILIRNIQNENVDPVTFKTDQLKFLAAKVPWIVFIDDDPMFIKSALENVDNCLAINILQGEMKSDIEDDRLIKIKRFPDEIQAMYPLMDAVERALR